MTHLFPWQSRSEVIQDYFLIKQSQAIFPLNIWIMPSFLFRKHTKEQIELKMTLDSTYLVWIKWSCDLMFRKQKFKLRCKTFTAECSVELLPCSSMQWISSCFVWFCLLNVTFIINLTDLRLSLFTGNMCNYDETHPEKEGKELPK